MHPKNSKYTLYDWEGVRPPGGVSSPSGRCPPLGGACHPIWRGVSFDLEGIRPPEGVSPPNHTPTVLARPSKWAVPPTWRGYAPWGAYPLPIIQILFRALSSRRSLQFGGAPHLEGNSLQVGGAPQIGMNLSIN